MTTWPREEVSDSSRGAVAVTVTSEVVAPTSRLGNDSRARMLNVSDPKGETQKRRSSSSTETPTSELYWQRSEKRHRSTRNSSETRENLVKACSVTCSPSLMTRTE